MEGDVSFCEKGTNQDATVYTALQGRFYVGDLNLFEKDCMIMQDRRSVMKPLGPFWSVFTDQSSRIACAGSIV